MKIDIALCTDEHFVIPALASITSIFENNKDDECCITVLTSGLSSSAINKFAQLAKYYNREICVKIISNSFFEGMITLKRYPLSMYFRFLLPKVLNDAERVLYLDCDTIIRGSLRKLYQTNLYKKACAVVVDQQCDDVLIINRLRISSPYFNSGVLLLNLDYWRKNDISNCLISYIHNNSNTCIYPDQDALNVILEGKVTYLPYKYNYQEMWATMRLQTRIHYSKWSKIEEASLNPIIVHYCVDVKPWFIECKNPYRDEFLCYALKHSFVGFKRKKKYGWLYHWLVAWEMRFHLGA